MVFEETSPEVIWDLVARHPLGLLVTAGAEGPMASPLPFLRSERGGRPCLTAHMSRANPHLAALSEGLQALVVFQGADAYVTPSWYPSKAKTGKVVPTWNYEMVQVRGTIRLQPRAEWLAGQVAALTDAQEAARPRPWSASDAPAAFLEAQLRAIVGLEVEITGIRGKWKMSQNRPLADMAGVARGLADPADPHHHPAAAALVAERLAAREGS